MYKLNDVIIRCIENSTAQGLERNLTPERIRENCLMNVLGGSDHATAVATVLVVFLHQKGNPLNFESKAFTKPLKEVATLMCDKETTEALAEVWTNHLSDEATKGDLIDLLTFLWTEQLTAAQPPTT